MILARRRPDAVVGTRQSLHPGLYDVYVSCADPL